MSIGVGSLELAPILFLAIRIEKALVLRYFVRNRNDGKTYGFFVVFERKQIFTEFLKDKILQIFQKLLLDFLPIIRYDMVDIKIGLMLEVRSQSAEILPDTKNQENVNVLLFKYNRKEPCKKIQKKYNKNKYTNAKMY